MSTETPESSPNAGNEVETRKKLDAAIELEVRDSVRREVAYHAKVFLAVLGGVNAAGLIVIAIGVFGYVPGAVLSRMDINGSIQQQHETLGANKSKIELLQQRAVTMQAIVDSLAKNPEAQKQVENLLKFLDDSKNKTTLDEFVSVRDRVNAVIPDKSRLILSKGNTTGRIFVQDEMGRLKIQIFNGGEGRELSLRSGLTFLELQAATASLGGNAETVASVILIEHLKSTP